MDQLNVPGARGQGSVAESRTAGRTPRPWYLALGVALALMGFAGFYNYSAWKHNAAEAGKLKASFDELKHWNGRNPNPELDRVEVAAAGAATADATGEVPKITLRCRAVIPSPGVGDAVTTIAYAVQNELRASTNLFDPKETRLGEQINPDHNPDPDTFTFNVTLALKRPIKL